MVRQIFKYSHLQLYLQGGEEIFEAFFTKIETAILKTSPRVESIQAIQGQHWRWFFGIPLILETECMYFMRSRLNLKCLSFQIYQIMKKSLKLQ